ncbi:uncharacterized protein V6R79_014612 [Siganus canaliculatus]
MQPARSSDLVQQVDHLRLTSRTWFDQNQDQDQDQGCFDTQVSMMTSDLAEGSEVIQAERRKLRRTMVDLEGELAHLEAQVVALEASGLERDQVLVQQLLVLQQAADGLSADLESLLVAAASRASDHQVLLDAKNGLEAEIQDYRRLLGGSRPEAEIQDYRRLLDGPRPEAEIQDHRRLLDGPRPEAMIQNYRRQLGTGLMLGENIKPVEAQDVFRNHIQAGPGPGPGPGPEPVQPSINAALSLFLQSENQDTSGPEAKSRPGSTTESSVSSEMKRLEDDSGPDMSGPQVLQPRNQDQDQEEGQTTAPGPDVSGPQVLQPRNQDQDQEEGQTTAPGPEVSGPQVLQPKNQNQDQDQEQGQTTAPRPEVSGPQVLQPRNQDQDQEEGQTTAPGPDVSGPQVLQPRNQDQDQEEGQTTAPGPDVSGSQVLQPRNQDQDQDQEEGQTTTPGPDVSGPQDLQPKNQDQEGQTTAPGPDVPGPQVLQPRNQDQEKGQTTAPGPDVPRPQVLQPRNQDQDQEEGQTTGPGPEVSGPQVLQPRNQTQDQEGGGSTAITSDQPVASEGKQRVLESDLQTETQSQENLCGGDSIHPEGTQAVEEEPDGNRPEPDHVPGAELAELEEETGTVQAPNPDPGRVLRSEEDQAEKAAGSASSGESGREPDSTDPDSGLSSAGFSSPQISKTIEPADPEPDPTEGSVQAWSPEPAQAASLETQEEPGREPGPEEGHSDVSGPLAVTEALDKEVQGLDQSLTLSDRDAAPSRGPEMDQISAGTQEPRNQSELREEPPETTVPPKDLEETWKTSSRRDEKMVHGGHKRTQRSQASSPALSPHDNGRFGTGDWIVYAGLARQSGLSRTRSEEIPSTPTVPDSTRSREKVDSSKGLQRAGSLPTGSTKWRVYSSLDQDKSTSPTGSAGSGRFGSSGEWRVYGGSSGRVSRASSQTSIQTGSQTGSQSRSQTNSQTNSQTGSQTGSTRLRLSGGSVVRRSNSLGSGGGLSSSWTQLRTSTPSKHGSTGSGERRPVYSSSSSRKSGGARSGAAGPIRGPRTQSPGGRVYVSSYATSSGSGGSDRPGGRARSTGGRVISSSDRPIRSTGSGAGGSKERISVCKMAALSMSAARRERGQEQDQKVQQQKKAAASSRFLQRWLTSGSHSADADDLDDVTHP